MRWAQPTLTVDNLRSELEKFAADKLQQEFSTLRDHIDRAVKRELVGFHRGYSSMELDGAITRGGSVPDSIEQPRCADPVVGPPVMPQRAGEVVPHARNRCSELTWATHRAGFPDSGAKGFARRRSRRFQSGRAARTSAVSYSALEEPLEGKGEYASETSEQDHRGSRDVALSVNEASRRPQICNRLVELGVMAVESEYFDYVLGGFILANAAAIGAETHYMAEHWSVKVPTFFRAVDHFFFTVFLLEVVMRFCASGCLTFFTEQGWKWNVFDLLVVTLQMFDEVMRFWTYPWFEKPQGMAGNHLSALRILRLFRLVRLLRLTRMLHILGGLRMLVVSIGDSIRSLAWTLILLFVLTFVFGVFLTRLVTEHKVQHDSEEDVEKMEELLFYFGTLDASMLCLYENISEGLHWNEVVRPLMDRCGSWLAVVFVAYMSFTLFALMNVVTGVFCESAIRTAEEDKKQVLLQQMHEMFMEADDDGSGTISAEEFEKHLKDPQMLMYLKAIDVNPEEARHLFSLLDSDDSGEIEAEALVNGCLRLQGSAKAIELAAFMNEHKIEYQRILEHVDNVERSLSWVCDNLMAKDSRLSKEPA